MKFVAFVVLFAASGFAAQESDLQGTWKVVYAGEPGTAPKTVGSIIFTFNVAGGTVTGTANIGPWPGLAPIADGKVDGGHITFAATGTRDSTTGIPTCQFDIVVRGDEMTATMRVIRNAGGPLSASRDYRYTGKRFAP